nr:hypothetical protein [Comamonas testosteroni]
MKKTILILSLTAFAAFIGNSAFSAAEPARSLVQDRQATIEAKLDELTR